MPDIILNDKFIKNILEDVHSPCSQSRFQEETDRFLFYNGQIQEIIKKAISKEFAKEETIKELCSRIIPINIVKKIIDKLAAVYIEPPMRVAGNDDSLDQELLDILADSMKMNVRMKDANKLFKLDKKVLMELYLDYDGFPQARVLPAHTYRVFSHSLISPEMPDTIVKWLNPGENIKEKQKFIIWTDNEFRVVNGDGKTLQYIMDELNNPEGINPFETLPFVYMSDALNAVEPIYDDDLMKTSIAVNVLMSDLLFASKYKSWGMVYTIGEVGDLPFNPNSVAHLNYDVNGNKPEIGQISPDINFDGILKTIESMLSMLLSSRNLSVKTIANTISVDNIASGVSKAIDQSEVLEDRKKQHDSFMRFEEELWDKLAFKMMPYWRSVGELNEKVNYEFSPDFSVNIILKEPTVQLSESEKVDIVIKKLDAGLINQRMAMQELNPDLTDDEIEKILESLESSNNIMVMDQPEPQLQEEVNGEENIE